MFRFSGGERVKKGHYWNFSTGERVRFEEEGILPGGGKDIYLRASSVLVLLVVAPFLGLAYAFFLPTVGIAMLAIAAVRKIPDMIWPGLERISNKGLVKRAGLERLPDSDEDP